MTYKEIKDKHKLTDHDIGLMFGYKSGHSFTSSHKFKVIVAGIERLYNVFLKDKELNKKKVIRAVTDKIKGI
jgi:hypothetical protein